MKMLIDKNRVGWVYTTGELDFNSNKVAALLKVSF